MKKRQISIIILTLLNTGGVLFLACTTYKPIVETIHTERVIESVPQQPIIYPSDVYVPEEFYFAGERVPLERIDIKEAFTRELIVNTYLHSSTIQLLKNAPRYFEVIEPILKSEGMHDDFKYLAVIESSLNPLALSPSKAAGIWQFLAGTAKEYGMEVTDEVDERYHLEKATKAACDYLKNAYEKFGSWALAAAAYNGGPNMITKQIELQKENNYYDLLFGQETGRYLFRMLAIKQIVENPEIYDFIVTEKYEPERVEHIKITQSIKDLAEFAQQHGISYKILKRFNPWLRKNTLKVKSNKEYLIAIPKEKSRYKTTISD